MAEEREEKFPPDLLRSTGVGGGEYPSTEPRGNHVRLLAIERYAPAPAWPYEALGSGDGAAERRKRWLESEN